MPQIVTVGETMAAFTPGSTGFLRYVKNYEMRIAGAESNLAIGVSKLGHSAGWISCLGRDEFGEFVRNSIRAEGVDTSRVVFDPEYRTGIMFKQVRNASETSVFYYRENSAASHMHPRILDVDYLAQPMSSILPGLRLCWGTAAGRLYWLPWIWRESIKSLSALTPISAGSFGRTGTLCQCSGI